MKGGIAAALVLVVGMACATWQGFDVQGPISLAVRSHEPGQLVMALRIPPATANRITVLRWENGETLSGGSTEIALSGKTEPGSLYLREARVERGAYTVVANLYDWQDARLGSDQAQVIVR